MKKNIDKSVLIGNVNISGTHKNQVLRKLYLQRKNLHHIVTVNPEFVIEARRNPKFEDVLACANERVADGWGVVLAARILYGVKLPRISGDFLVEKILSHSGEHGKKVFLLGGGEGVAEQAAREMRRVYPGLRVEYYEGSRRVAREKREEAGLTLAKINAFEPDYLLVAYGSPWQDIWIEENREYLRAGVAVGVGGILDEWAGVVKKCPKLLDKIGLKWMWRLFWQPWRWRRVARVFWFGLLVAGWKTRQVLTS